MKHSVVIRCDTLQRLVSHCDILQVKREIGVPWANRDDVAARERLESFQKSSIFFRGNTLITSHSELKFSNDLLIILVLFVGKGSSINDVRVIDGINGQHPSGVARYLPWGCKSILFLHIILCS